MLCLLQNMDNPQPNTLPPRVTIAIRRQYLNHINKIKSHLYLSESVKPESDSHIVTHQYIVELALETLLTKLENEQANK